MPLRSWAGIQTLVATSQPVFGTAMNGAGVRTLDQHTLNTSIGSQDSQTVLPVTSTIGFQKGDNVIVAPRTSFFQGSTGLDFGRIFAITPGVSIQVQGLLNLHASGELVMLNEDVTHVTVVPIVGNAAVIYLGNSYTVAAADPSLFDILPVITAPGQPTYWHNPPNVGGGAGYKTSEYWIMGTTGDKFFARIEVI